MPVAALQHSPLFPSASRLPVDIYYETAGNGPVKLFFIMGLNTSSNAWSFQVPFFAKQKQYTTCVFDNRGAGFSSLPKERYTTQKMAQDCLALLRHLKWDTAHVIGVSMGGMIALELASMSPAVIDSLMLVSTSAGTLFQTFASLSSFPRAVLASSVEAKAAILAENLFTDAWLARPGPPDSGFATNRDWVMEIIMDRKSTVPLQPFFGALSQGMACLGHWVSAARLKRAGQALEGRCLVVTGTSDRIVDPKHSLYIADKMGAALQVYVGSGHGLNTEMPTTFNNLIKTWVDGTPTRLAQIKAAKASGKPLENLGGYGGFFEINS